MLAGRIAPEELVRVFNCGIGMVVIVPASHADAALRLLVAQGFVTLGETRVAARSTYLARRSDSLYSRA